MERQVPESDCYGNRPSFPALLGVAWHSGIRAQVTALDGQILTAAPGRSLGKRALPSTPLERKQMNLTPSQPPKSFSMGQRFSLPDTLTSEVSYYLLRAVVSFPIPSNSVPMSILPLDPHGPTSPRHCPHLAPGCTVAVSLRVLSPCSLSWVKRKNFLLWAKGSRRWWQFSPFGVRH